jgi:gluconolactonase
MNDTEATVFAAHNEEFAEVVGDNPRLVRVTSVDAHEGPVYPEDEDALYFTSTPSRGNRSRPLVAIKRMALAWDRSSVDAAGVTVVVADSNAANGMTMDRDGHLVVCEQGTMTEPARVSRLDRDTRTIETVVDAWGNNPLNSPNDVVVRSDGSIWFTDPSYGYLQGFRPEPPVGDHVFRYGPNSHDLSVVADSLVKPNGLAFSPDEQTLYVTDSGANLEPGSYDDSRPHHIVAFTVDGRRLRDGRVFAMTTPGFPDGIKVDDAGRVYASAFSGVQVFNPGGNIIGEIRLPGAVNFTFGGPERNTLFITTDTAVWAAFLSATAPQAKNRREGR